jgi:hypothetical protein
MKVMKDSASAEPPAACGCRSCVRGSIEISYARKVIEITPGNIGARS